MTRGRLALVVYVFPKLSETFIVNKYLGLRARGWDVHVVCAASEPAAWGHFPTLSADEKARVHVLPGRRPLWANAALAPVALSRSSARNPRATTSYLRRGLSMPGLSGWRGLFFDAELLRLKPDVLHFEFGTLALGRLHLRELLPASVAVSFRGFDINFALLEDEHAYDDIWRGADVLHFLGNDLRRRALQRGCPPDKPTVLIPPAIDTDLFRSPPRPTRGRAGTPENPLRILSVGRLEWKKGYEFGLAAVRLLVDRGVRCEYRIVGNGQHAPALQFARYDMGLAKEVSFLGARTPAEVRAEMEWSDVLLHAAVSEGFCNAVLESQAMERAVVCTDADGLPENVVHGATGLVVPRRDPRLLADALEALAADGEWRERLGKAGRERVVTEFRLDDQIRRFEALYEELLAGRVDPRPGARQRRGVRASTG